MSSVRPPQKDTATLNDLMIRDQDRAALVDFMKTLEARANKIFGRNLFSAKTTEFYSAQAGQSMASAPSNNEFFSGIRQIFNLEYPTVTFFLMLEYAVSQEDKKALREAIKRELHLSDNELLEAMRAFQEAMMAARNEDPNIDEMVAAYAASASQAYFAQNSDNSIVALFIRALVEALQGIDGVDITHTADGGFDVIFPPQQQVQDPRQTMASAPVFHVAPAPRPRHSTHKAQQQPAVTIGLANNMPTQLSQPYLGHVAQGTQRIFGAAAQAHQMGYGLPMMITADNLRDAFSMISSMLNQMGMVTHDAVSFQPHMTHPRMAYGRGNDADLPQDGPYPHPRGER